MGQGTGVRLLTSAGTVTALALWGRLPGVAIGTLALSAGVIVEAGYAHWAARKTVREKFGPDTPPPDRPDLSYRELVKFHSPLAATSLLFLLTLPLTGAALARVPDPETVLAAWPVVAGVLFFTRAPALALPEVIIALIDEGGSSGPLRKFSLRVGLASMGVLALISFTPLGRFYFQTLIGVNEGLATRAIPGGQIGLLLPFIVAGQSWFRGLLTANRATLPITLAMVVNLMTMVTALATGIALQAPGVPLAALALTLASGAETLLLWAAARRLPHPRPLPRPAGGQVR